ncbi:hypothetical protein QQP08_005284 [Theobroma cacao]|nr:hypothetical protein QQP08_005284 [Theobroma cacao]
MIEAYNAEIGDLVGIIMPADFQCKGRNLPIDFCLKRIIDPPNRRRWREGACQKFVLIVDDPKLVKCQHLQVASDAFLRVVSTFLIQSRLASAVTGEGILVSFASVDR